MSYSQAMTPCPPFSMVFIHLTSIIIFSWTALLVLEVWNLAELTLMIDWALCKEKMFLLKKWKIWGIVKPQLLSIHRQINWYSPKYQYTNWEWATAWRKYLEYFSMYALLLVYSHVNLWCIIHISKNQWNKPTDRFDYLNEHLSCTWRNNLSNKKALCRWTKF